MARARAELLIETLEGGRLIKLTGVIDEGTDLSFFSRLRGHLRIDVAGVTRVNSHAVRSWLEAIRAIPAGTSFEFVGCSEAMIDRLTSVAGFQGRGRVSSFHAPMMCEACAVHAPHLFQVRECVTAGGRLPAVPCERCQRPMVLDDLEERYTQLIKLA